METLLPHHWVVTCPSATEEVTQPSGTKEEPPLGIIFPLSSPYAYEFWEKLFVSLLESAYNCQCKVIKSSLFLCIKQPTVCQRKAPWLPGSWVTIMSRGPLPTCDCCVALVGDKLWEFWSTETSQLFATAAWLTLSWLVKSLYSVSLPVQTGVR